MATCPACWAGSGSGAAIMSAAKARTAALRYDAVVLCMLTSPRLFSRHQWSVVAQGYSETEEYARRPPQCRQAALPFPEDRSEEHTSELQSQSNLVCRLLLEKKKNISH